MIENPPGTVIGSISDENIVSIETINPHQPYHIIGHIDTLEYLWSYHAATQSATFTCLEALHSGLGLGHHARKGYLILSGQTIVLHPQSITILNQTVNIHEV